VFDKHLNCNKILDMMHHKFSSSYSKYASFNGFHISAPIRGCFPINSSLSFFGSAPLLSSPVCKVQEAGPVSACMCTTTGCNEEGILFGKSNQLPRKPRDAESREPKNFIFPFANSSTVAKPLARGGRQAGLKCFSCGSLFNRDSPQCGQFDPDNEQQVMTCNEGEACMLYTWKKSKTEIGQISPQP
jgi:hypothetical protein